MMEPDVVDGGVLASLKKDVMGLNYEGCTELANYFFERACDFHDWGFLRKGMRYFQLAMNHADAKGFAALQFLKEGETK